MSYGHVLKHVEVFSFLHLHRYLELQNNKGAVTQFSRIEKNNFSSEYFNFDIDLQKLLIQKQKIKN